MIGGGAPQGICGSGLVDLMSELLRTGRMNEMGRFEDDGDRITLDASTTSTSSKATSTNWRRPRARTSPACRWSASNYGIDFDDIDVFYLAGGFGRHLKVEASQRIGLIPEPPGCAHRAGRQRGHRRRVASRCSRAAKRQELEALVRRVEHCRLETHPDFFDFFVEGCQFKPVESAQPGGGMIGAGSTPHPEVDVPAAEYQRLLGYPRDHVLERARRELAEWAREWYAQHGRPWIYAREAETPAVDGAAIRIDGVRFHSSALRPALRAGRGACVVLVAVSAGPELEERSADVCGAKRSPTNTSSSKSSARRSSST